MSFSGDVKDELRGIVPRSRHCKIAQDKAREIFGTDSTNDRCDGLIVKSDCCRRTYIRTAFLEKGTVNDPAKGYHLEISCRSMQQAQQLRDLMSKDAINAKVTKRGDRASVYVKEAEQISDMLALMGAHKALLFLQNERIVHQMRESVNRRVNCETANINKTVSAAYRQIKAIEYIIAKEGLHNLPHPLREIAQLRLDEPEAALNELGERCEPPIGKSGVNHRLRKLTQYAENLGFDIKVENDT